MKEKNIQRLDVMGVLESGDEVEENDKYGSNSLTDDVSFKRADSVWANMSSRQTVALSRK